MPGHSLARAEGPKRRPSDSLRKQGEGEITNGILQDALKNTPAKPSDSIGTGNKPLKRFIL